uniref:Papain-like cysteine peptidase n=1 Tax=viral metagenome TaxID=1070528 RepID=A0A6C0B0R9_9ZZZZ
MEESISLGWNCDSASYGVTNGIRSTKQNGYKTCVFDEMITNYPGIVECIKNDFEGIVNLEYIELIRIPKESTYLNTNGKGDIVIYNNRYKFIFNHESPGHANLYITQNWKHGKKHYIMDNFKEFILRYTRRIQNIKEYLSSDKFIHFILTRPNTKEEDIFLLGNTIKEKYPLLKYNFVLLDYDKNIFYKHLLLMKFTEEDPEVKKINI